MKAAMPPAFCASATTCSATVVLPDDSGPKISTDAAARESADAERVVERNGAREMADTGTMASFDPSRTIEPFPNCFSIWPSVSPRVRARSFSSINVMSL